MSTNDLGPGYFDVSAFADEMRSLWGCDVSFRVCPPVRIVATGKYTSWYVWCEVRKEPGYGPIRHTAASTYGKNGAWKTLPAAMYHAARLVEEEMQKAALAAQRSSAF